MSVMPLGKTTAIPQRYAPQSLYAIARADARAALSLSAPLPFSGVDIWTAWELTWLQPGGVPQAAIGEFRIPADSPRLVESKSMKLYLNSFAMSEFASADAVREVIANDLGACTGADVNVRIAALNALDALAAAGEPPAYAALPGDSIDTQAIDIANGDLQNGSEPDPTLLCLASGGANGQGNVDNGGNVNEQTGEMGGNADNAAVKETLHSHLLRSLCPVTGQPDSGSIIIAYEGAAIDRAGLLRYIVSHRQHQAFHETCMEGIFIDILRRCKPRSLSVHARYQRRGGIDINPYRCNDNSTPDNLRLWRQ